MSIHALILAGGEGSRLGAVRKDTLRLGGISMLERVAGRLRDVERPLLISTGRQAFAEREGERYLPDLDLPIGGPMAGLVAAAERLAGHDDTDLLLTVAVDTPFLPDDFVRRLVAAPGPGDAAAQAGWGGNVYPTNAIWRLSALRDLPALAQDRSLPKSPKALLARLKATTVDWADTHAADPFANLNTLNDLLSLARRAQAEGL